MASKEEDEKRKSKRRQKHDEEKRKRKKRKKGSYVSSFDSSDSSSDSSDFDEWVHFSHRKKKYGKKSKPSQNRDGPIIILTNEEMGIKGLKAWNKKQLKSGGIQYQFVRVLHRDSCPIFLKGLIFHVNFEAKPASASDDEIQLFFAELKRDDVHRRGPYVTLCCPVQMTASLGVGSASGSTDEPGGGSADASDSGSGGLAEARVSDTCAASGGGLGDTSGGRGAGGSNDALSSPSSDRSRDCLDDGSKDNSSSEDLSSADDDDDDDDDVLRCFFCPPKLIHPARGFDVGISLYRIPVRKPPR